MEKTDFNYLSEEYLDVLKEIGNIGAGNAATALAQMLQCKVDMKVPKVKLLDFKDLGESMGGEEQIMSGIYFLVEGDITGSIMFLQSIESARVLVSKITGSPVAEDDFSEMEISALKEVGNIITGSYLSSLSQLTNLKITSSIPDLCIDMAGAILSVPAIELGEIGDKILLIQTQFSEEEDIDGYFILVPDIVSCDKILAALGM